jgi:hypothetical protein
MRERRVFNGPVLVKRNTKLILQPLGCMFHAMPSSILVSKSHADTLCENISPTESQNHQFRRQFSVGATRG